MANNRRPQMDYYEYKRRYEAARLARGGRPLQPSTPPEPEPAPEEKNKGRGLLGGLKQAVSGFSGRGGEAEEAPVQGQAPIADASSQERSSQEDPRLAVPQDELPSAADLPPQDVQPQEADLADALPLEEDELEEDDQQIDSPFADAAAVLKRLGGAVAGLGAKVKEARSRKGKKTRLEDGEAESGAPAVDVGLAANPQPDTAPQDIQQAAPEAASPSPSATSAAGDIPSAQKAQGEADQSPADIPDSREVQAPADIPDNWEAQAPADIPDNREVQAPADIPDDREAQAPVDVPSPQAPAQNPQESEDDEDAEEDAAEKRPKPFSFWPKRASRKTSKEEEPAPEEAEDEPEEKAAPRRKRFAFLGSPSQTSANQDGDNDDDEDIAPSGGGIHLFGRGGRSKASSKPSKKKVPALKASDLEADEDSEAIEPTPAQESRKDVFASAAEEDQQALQGALTRELAQDLDQEEETPSRRARRAAQTSRKERRNKAAQPPVHEPEEEDEEEQQPPVDEPTQAFRPLRHSRLEDEQRTRRFQPVRKSSAAGRVLEEDEDDYEDDYEDYDESDAYDDYEDYDEDDDLPVRGYVRRRRGSLRVYQDDDLDDEDGEGAGYDDYEDDYDDDVYEEDRLSFGKRMLRFLRVVLILALVLLVSILALRQLEANGVISLNLLRNSIGVFVPLDKVFPTPAPEAESQALDALPTAQPLPSLQPSTISGQVSVSPTASPETASPETASSSPEAPPQPTQAALEDLEATQVPVGVPLETPRASAQFLDEESPEAVG